MKLSLPPHGRPNRVYPPGTPGLHGLASVITGVVVVCALYFGRAVLIPITLSVLLSFLLAPLVQTLRRLHMGQLPSIFIAVLFALATLLAVGGLIGAQLVQLAGDLPQYQVAIEQKIETVQEKTVGRADSLMKRAAATLQRVAPSKPNPPRPTGRAARNAPAVPTPVEVHEPSPTPLQLAQRALSPAIAPLETTFIVLVVTIFILLQREDLRDRLISLFGSRDLHRTTTAINDAAGRLSRYFVAQLGVNVSAGGVIAIGLAIIGVPGALLFGVIAALLRFVPYIGIWIAAILAVFLAAAIQPQWTMAVYTLILFIVVDVVAGQVAEPLLYGHRSGLSPLAVVVAAIFWSWLWGPVGLVLSTPLTLCVVTLGRYADRLNFLTVLLGDQPALTPAQTFYQRLLADDPHEAIVQAERLLREMSLIDYYDKVALEGLKLARNDAMRGVLMPEQLARVNESLVDIVENLEIADGVPERLSRADPAESAGAALASASADLSERPESHMSAHPHSRAETEKTSVLCVPGRGAFDEVTTAIAVQLLGRQGLAPLMATHSGYRSARADEPAFKDAPIICIVSLDAPESPPYLRNMLRRTRQWRPRATLVVGVGGAPQAGPEMGATGASHAAPTFRAMIEECLAAAGTQHARQASHVGGSG
ncbi:AI-2E family transporter [Paraburkholderia sp. 22099]|jgi:predicted PurR-regulated permease PerM|uniref:Predicted PurR-regulated permease PerM n=1 Tax=Paraburkholderia terricola TaxID=169427 RepID=A0A1M6RAU0_9BURK|nr:MULTISPECIES: AI-2E family transporter [Paraburkholderia]MDR6449027.1 putative PurR-regulated permease PerM [Paraburkholderia terricola]MDR6495138.1 putative PurR-regulated permease PerM [Paraburkholderia terricola]SDP21113.1 Predicted PurR-regulated permease PerM [Paraburkholderia sediminicola]SHK29584.1 Predicted PurR-regulated permease PerM [Paraburkholderia terricola]